MALCAGSLALNLLMGGAIVAHLLVPERMERLTTSGPHSQLLSRRFFSDLTPERRRELTGILKSYKNAFQERRQELQGASQKLADALDAEPFRAEAVAAAVAAFAQAGNGMMAEGAKAALDFLGRLTPDERKLLAQRLRERKSRKK